MPFARPSLSDLVSRAFSDMKSKIPGTDPLLRRSNERIIAAVQAGLANELHGHMAWVAKQIFIDLADEETVLRRAGELGIERKSAQKASGTITITGTNGSTAPIDKQWQTGDGVVYKQTAAATIASGSASASVEAIEAGADGNQDTGVALSAVSATTGIDSAAVVESPGLEGGLDIESIDELRVRIKQRRANPPKGGGPGDYVGWALEVPGVTRAWEFASVGAVEILFVLDNQSGSILPSAAKITEVLDYVSSVCPVTVDLSVGAPTLVSLDPDITITPDTADIRAAVEAELDDYILRRGEPGGLHYLSQINESIGLADGEEDHALNSPTADLQLNPKELLEVGTITWS